MRRPKLTHTYHGVVIFRNTCPGFALRWTARTDSGSLAADTLADIKALIRKARTITVTTGGPTR